MRYSNEKDAKRAAEDLRNHVAKRRKLGENFEVIEFARPGTYEYAMRFVFDEEANVLTISGDLGHAVVRTDWKLTPETFVDAFHVKNLHYFNEKIEAAESQYCFDADDFAEELDEWAEEWPRCREDEDEGEGEEEEVDDDDGEYSEDGFTGDEVEELKGALTEAFTWEHGVELALLDPSARALLDKLDSECWEWIESAGKRYDYRMFCWVSGLNMAMEQLAAHDAPAPQEEEGGAE